MLLQRGLSLLDAHPRLLLAGVGMAGLTLVAGGIALAQTMNLAA